jgi:IS5 family transposase
MYRKETKGQLSFADFYLPFGGKLNAENRWVKLASFVPWEIFENKYAEQFSEAGIGAPAKSFRIALGSLLIKEKLNITDEETIEQIRENPYLQFFIGMEGYRDEIPFDSSMMVHFRKRITFSMLSEINEQIQEAYSKKKYKKTLTLKIPISSHQPIKGNCLLMQHVRQQTYVIPQIYLS